MGNRQTDKQAYAERNKEKLTGQTDKGRVTGTDRPRETERMDKDRQDRQERLTEQTETKTG